MDCQPGVSPPSTEASPTHAAPAKVAGASWSVSAQLALGTLLAAGFIFLAGKSLFQSLQAGSSTLPSQQIELNTATHVELMLLPGVGEQLVRRIIKVRDEKGGFQKIDDLRKVPGLGPVTLQRLRGWVVISANPSPPIKLDAVLPLTVEPSKRPAAKANKATSLTEPVEVNTASREQLMAIPGIGPKLSQNIIDQRAQKPFQTVADLRRVPGIGVKTLEKIKPFITVH
jgi:competence protein ComEA